MPYPKLQFPLSANFTGKRVIAPPTQNNPSRNGSPPPIGAVPWKNCSGGVGVMPEACSTTESLLTDAIPFDHNTAPVAFDELPQPRPTVPKLPHGQALPVPSPAQKFMPGGRSKSVSKPSTS